MGEIKTFVYDGPVKNPTASVLLRLIDYHGPIAVDIETPSLDDRSILGAAVAISPDESFYFPLHSQVFPWDKLKDPSIQKRFHNSSYDVPELEKTNGNKVVNYVDTMIMARLLGLPPKLLTLADKFLNKKGIDIEDLIGKKGVNQKTMSEIPDAEVAKKSCMDARLTWEIGEKLEPKIPQKAFDLDMRLLPILWQLQDRGIRIDIDKLKEHKTRLKKEVDYLRNIAKGKGFNPGSNKQLAYILMDLGYHVRFKRTTGNPILPKEVIQTEFRDEPIALLSMIYKSKRSSLSDLEAILNKHLVGDIIHPHWNILGAASGRLSASKPNTQNVTEDLRDMYIPSDGNRWIVWDMSQVELRVLAYLSQDPEMLKVFSYPMTDPRGDMHLEAAAEVGVPGSRKLGKAVNYAVTYGGTAYTLWEHGGIPPDVGELYIQLYFKKYRKAKEYIDEQKEFILKNYYSETMYGRRRYCTDELMSGNKWKIEKALRELINHTIQGTASEAQKELMIIAEKEPQNNSVHDEIDFDSPMGQYPPSPPTQDWMPFTIPIKVGSGLNWKGAKQ